MSKRLLIATASLFLAGPWIGIAGSLQEADRAQSYYHFSLAKLYAEDQKFAESIAEFEQALDLDPESARLHFEFAETLRQAGAINRAMEEGRKSVELDPSDPDPHLLLGQIYYRAYQRGSADMLDAAVAEWKKVNELNPSEAEALYYLALHYYEQKDFAQAAETFKRLNQVRPGYTRGYLSEAHALFVSLGKLLNALMHDITDAAHNGGLGNSRAVPYIAYLGDIIQVVVEKIP